LTFFGFDAILPIDNKKKNKNNNLNNVENCAAFSNSNDDSFSNSSNVNSNINNNDKNKKNLNDDPINQYRELKNSKSNMNLVEKKNIFENKESDNNIENNNNNNNHNKNKLSKPKIVIIDVNYFPSFKEVKNFPEQLIKIIVEKTKNKQLSLKN
jgi:hypothetical protein